MDVEKLINLVQMRNPLWEQRNKDYHNRYKVSNLWEEVAKELNVTTTEAKKRWKSLRDVFRTELKKIPKPKSGDSAPSSFTSSWCHFNNLLFLRDTMVPRQLTGNLSLIEVEEEVSQAASDSIQTNNETDGFSQVDDMEYQQDLAKNENTANTNTGGDNNLVTTPQEETNEHRTQNVLSGPGAHEPQRPTTFKQKRNNKRKQEFDVDRFLALEQEKITLLKSDGFNSPPQDDDYHYLMSLYPALKRMRIDTKMWFRLKIQELLYNSTLNEMSQQQVNTNALPTASAVASPLYSPTPSTSSNFSE